MNYRDHYRIDAVEFDYWGADQLSPTETRRNQVIYDLSAVKAGDTVLDLGSGRGWFSLYASQQGAEITALDLSEANLEKIKAADDKINILYGDACFVPVQDKQFDLIVALEILEHIVDPKAAVTDWKRLLKPNGRLLVTVPFREAIRYTLCIHCNQKTPVNAHLHSFEREALIKLLNHHGFWVKETCLFAHKLLTTLRINYLTRWLPYRWWKGLDRICRVFGKQYSYLAVSAVLKT
jgi:2-polyprenyl-3-methyl-5-hydroxy-6-metoxy-1,4-benzoquinol methylase